MTTYGGLRTRSWANGRAVFLAAALALALARAAHGSGGDDCPDTHAEDLEPAEPKSGLAALVTCPNGPIFALAVPPGANRLSLSTGGGTGNANLLVKFGVIPTRASFDYFAGGPTNTEAIDIASPAPGTWYVVLDPDASFAGVTLTANVFVDDRPVHDDEPEHDISDPRPDGELFFSIDVPPGIARMQVTTGGGTGSLDLYVRRDAIPTRTVFDGSSLSVTTANAISIPSPQGGNWKIGLFGRSAFSGVTLLVNLTPAAQTCIAAPGSLCLVGHRFKVEVDWSNQHAPGEHGSGTAIAGTDETGYFWFFAPTNTELVVKVLDGRALNGHFWFFHGGLSDVEYTIRVTDTQTGSVRSYHKPPGTLNGGADTAAF